PYLLFLMGYCLQRRQRPARVLGAEPRGDLDDDALGGAIVTGLGGEPHMEIQVRDRMAVGRLWPFLADTEQVAVYLDWNPIVRSDLLSVGWTPLAHVLALDAWRPFERQECLHCDRLPAAHIDAVLQPIELGISPVALPRAALEDLFGRCGMRTGWYRS